MSNDNDNYQVYMLHKCIQNYTRQSALYKSAVVQRFPLPTYCIFNNDVMLPWCKQWCKVVQIYIKFQSHTIFYTCIFTCLILYGFFQDSGMLKRHDKAIYTSLLDYNTNLSFENLNVNKHKQRTLTNIKQNVNKHKQRKMQYIRFLLNLCVNRHIVHAIVTEGKSLFTLH